MRSRRPPCRRQQRSRREYWYQYIKGGEAGGSAPVSKEYGKSQPLRVLCFSLSRYRLNRLSVLWSESGAWGHTAHRGWARLLLDRARDLIIHGSAHRGANGVAMPTDEDDQDGHFFYNHPERGAYFAA